MCCSLPSWQHHHYLHCYQATRVNPKHPLYPTFANSITEQGTAVPAQGFVTRGANSWAGALSDHFDTREPGMPDNCVPYAFYCTKYTERIKEIHFQHEVHERITYSITSTCYFCFNLIWIIFGIGWKSRECWTDGKFINVQNNTLVKVHKVHSILE